MFTGHRLSAFHACLFILTLACLTLGLHGQGLTGQISGVVQDSSGAVVVGAKIDLTNTRTGQTRQGASDGSGAFVFTQLLPGQYKVGVTAPGFKAYEQTDISLTATERVALRPIVLTLGVTSDSVTVTAEAAQLQTQSGERSGLLSTSQLVAAPVKGRNYLSLLALLPGITITENLEGPKNGLDTIHINGSQGQSVSLNLDGIPNHDTGGQGGPQVVPAMESIAEVKVLTTNFQAEYGRSWGGTINTVTRAGTREFHGGAYYFKRNEALNANNFFSNRDGAKRPRYRYDYPGYFVGGPVLIPGVNQSRDKLFFFWSQEFLPRTTPGSLGRATFPTTLERAGNFSQTVDTNGKVIPILDPLNNGAPFSGNVIQPSRIDPTGQKLLSVFPMPNFVDPAHTYNTIYQGQTKSPYRFELLRVDWNVSSNTTFYARGHHSMSKDRGTACCFSGNSFPMIEAEYAMPTRGVVATLIHTFTPTFVTETTFGVNRFTQDTIPNPATLQNWDRVHTGVDFPQMNPSMNPYNVLPSTSFSGVPNAGNIGWEARFPFFGTNNIWNVSQNVTKVQGAHNIKAGFYLEVASRNATAWAGGLSYMGKVDFGRNVNNPLDSNYAYSNAMLGTINAYSESNNRLITHARYKNAEWFVQDNWRLHKRFTLDLGVRFYHIIATSVAGGTLAAFDPTIYDRSKAAGLIQPYRASSTSARMGRNPATGEIVPEVLIGNLAPGSGTFFQGMRSYSESIMNAPALVAVPRVGFAWDVLGNGKFAVRGGFGIFPGRIADDRTSDFLFGPPAYTLFTLNYTTIGGLRSAPKNYSPNSVLSAERDYHLPSTYSWSLGVQKDIGFGTVLDVAYVGSVTRHTLLYQSLNATPYGTNFLATSQDTTVSGNKPLPINFLRPITGYADIQYYSFSGSSNYHSMQTQLNRRLKQDLLFGVAWTWSKTLDFTDGANTVNPFFNLRTRSYGKAGFDRTHVVVANFSYSVPKVRGRLSNPVTRTVLDNWEVAGIVSLLEGPPMGMGYSLASGADLTGNGGAGVDSRVVLTCNANLPAGERTMLRAFRTECVQPPIAAGDFGRGNAPKDVFRGPGINNWDLSLVKNFPFGKDTERRLQFRAEMYNTFNHVQFTSVDTGARFDALGNQINSRFGQYTSSADARRIQLALKFYF